jgi:hypothetical protein
MLQKIREKIKKSSRTSQMSKMWYVDESKVA